MKLTEALQIARRAPADAPVFKVLLVCGFTPMHMQAFLAAHLQLTLRQRRVVIDTGLYGDVAGTLAKLEHGDFHTVAINLDWPDLDPRLGYRHLGGWGPSELADIVQNLPARLSWFQQLLATAPSRTQIALCLPMSPLPPVFYTPSALAGKQELALEKALADFAYSVSNQSNIRVVSRRAVDRASAPSDRFDLKSEIVADLPYTLTHANTIAQCLANLLAPPAPKKGIITDLDDTFWSGIVGEIGPDAICWDLAGYAQLHGLYQQLLRALADQGVLIAIASKNSPESVHQAFAREDILLPKHRIFPLEVHWNRKSESITRILKAWNISADSVVFVDDSPLELDEVKQVHPEIECVLFSKEDYTAAYDFFFRLREMFGKERISQEDALRLESLRGTAALNEAQQDDGISAENFLRGVDATITAEINSRDPRVLELVNKTNQFNLNGERYTQSEWADALQQQGAFLITISYADKYGSLGKIAVFQGILQNGRVHAKTWVMSCRAFSRRIEHQTLKFLFDQFDVDTVTLAFKHTEKNGPLREFLAAFADEDPTAQPGIFRSAFENGCPPLYHRVVVTEWAHSTSNT